MDIASIATQITGANEAHVATNPPSAVSPGPHYLARNPGQSSHESKPSTARTLPDQTICRVKSANFGDYADCLVEHPFQCRYALGLGGGFLCLHPQKNDFVMRTAVNGQGNHSFTMSPPMS
jgi:hypothetical protein